MQGTGVLKTLLDRKLIGPIPAVEGLDVKQRKLPDGTFRYDIAPPSGLSSNDPAFGLPTMSGTKQIERLNF